MDTVHTSSNVHSYEREDLYYLDVAAYLMCDHGTNVVGATRELKEVYDFLSKQRVQGAMSKFCSTQTIEWRFIPPHFGGLWELAVHKSLSQLRLLIIDEVSSLNLAYIHLLLNEIFAKDEWFGSVNVLFVGDILQLRPINGGTVFERISNKSN